MSETFFILRRTERAKIAIIKNGQLVEAGPTADIVGKSSLETVFLELANESAGEAVPNFDTAEVR